MKRILLLVLFPAMTAAADDEPGGIANPDFENGREMWIFETGNVRIADNVALERSVSAVEMVSPPPDSRFTCNTPLFVWKESPGARSYSVVVSTTADFSRDVRTYPTSGLESFRLTEKLSPGVWYWKTVAPGRENAAARKVWCHSE